MEGWPLNPSPRVSFSAAKARQDAGLEGPPPAKSKPYRDGVIWTGWVKSDRLKKLDMKTVESVDRETAERVVSVAASKVADETIATTTTTATIKEVLMEKIMFVSMEGKVESLEKIGVDLTVIEEGFKKEHLEGEEVVLEATGKLNEALERVEGLEDKDDFWRSTSTLGWSKTRWFCSFG